MQSKQKYNLAKWPIIIGVVLVAVGLVFWASRSYFTNYAEEVAAPLEDALIKQGGIKYYKNGDAGYGPDNRRPWLQVFYELPIDTEEAVQLATKIAKDNGNTLAHATPDNRGPLSVADVFIDKWYFDYSSRAADYPKLEKGSIKLAFIVDGPSSTYSSGRAIPEGHSIIGIDIALPEFKQ